MEESGHIYGRRAVLEALRSSPDRVNKLFIAEGTRGRTMNEIRDLARRHRVVTKTLPRRALERYAPDAAHQGVVASMAPVSYADVDDMLEPRREGRSALILVLDGITDPQNFGAILRTADAAGVSGVIIPRHRSVGLSPVVAKQSAGAAHYVPVARVPNTAAVIDKLREHGVQTVGAAGDAEMTMYEIDFKLPTALVIGSEGAGLRPLVRRKCELTARIPMEGRISSLNAGVAAAVILYESVRQRSGPSSTRSITSNPP